jgi:hypothetical protein
MIELVRSNPNITFNALVGLINRNPTDYLRNTFNEVINELPNIRQQGRGRGVRRLGIQRPNSHFNQVNAALRLGREIGLDEEKEFSQYYEPRGYRRVTRNDLEFIRSGIRERQEGTAQSFLNRGFGDLNIGNMDNRSIRRVMENYVLSNNENQPNDLFLYYNNRIRPVNEKTLGLMNDFLSLGLDELNERYQEVSDADLIQYLGQSVDRGSLRLEYGLPRRRFLDGGFFKYFLNEKYRDNGKLSYALRKYQIFHDNTIGRQWDFDEEEICIPGKIEFRKNEEKPMVGNFHCLHYAFLQSGLFDEDDVHMYFLYLTSSNIPKSSFKEIALKFNVHIKLRMNRASNGNHNRSDVISYNKGAEKILELGLIENHYFIIDQTEFTSFSLEHYDECKTYERWNEIVGFNNNGYPKRDTNRFMNSFQLINLLVNNKDEFLEPITIDNVDPYLLTKSQIKTKYETLPDIEEDKDEEDEKEKDKYRREKKKMEDFEVNKPPGIFHKYFNFGLAFLDTEAFVNEKGIYEAYMCCVSIYDKDFHRKKYKIVKNEEGKDILTYTPPEEWMYAKPDHEPIKRTFIGNQHKIMKQALEFIGKYGPMTIVIHNSRFDSSFIIPYLWQVRNVIEKNNRLISLDGVFYYNYTIEKDGKLIQQKQQIPVHIIDSLSIINTKLSNFPTMFHLGDMKKEVIDYDVMNRDVLINSWVKIDDCKSLDDEQKLELIQNAKEWNIYSEAENSFHYILYSKKYCEMDVEILQRGYITMRQWIMEACMELNIFPVDIVYKLTIPSVAFTIAELYGCFDETYELSHIPQHFIFKCVVGGRCMTRKNELQYIDHAVDDFDACSMYVSAMVRMGGVLKGLPKVFNEPISYNEIKNATGYFIEIEITKVGRKYDFPLMSKINHETSVRDWTNDMVGETMFVDKTTLEDLIEFQEIEFNIKRGYIYNNGRNPKLPELATLLFDKRVQYKKQKNPIQEVFKLIGNSIYGKTIQKPIDTENAIVNEKHRMKYMSLHFNQITKATKVYHSEKWVIEKEKSNLNQYSLVHCGVEILSTSKRMMNEVMCLSEEHKIECYYTDTDSIHIDRRIDPFGKTPVERLGELYTEKYGRQLIGKGIGQFHCDFSFPYSDHNIDAKNPHTIYSEKFIAGGKKMYIDRIVCEMENGQKHYAYHCRLKGIITKSIFIKAKEMKTDAMGIYERMYDGEKMKFDLQAGGKCMNSLRDYSIERCTEFMREVSFY